MPFFLAIKEILNNKGRFILISLIVTLITVLVLFIAALAEGLAASNKEYIQELTGELLVYQANVELSIPASRIGRSRVNQIRRVGGVADVGQVGFSTGTIVFDQGTLRPSAAGQEQLDIALIGVEPGRPGEPLLTAGDPLGRRSSNGVIIGQNVALRRDIIIGDTITIKTIQATKEKFFSVVVIGIAGKSLYQFQPAVIAPYLTWEKVRPQANPGQSSGDLVSNIVSVRVTDRTQAAAIAEQIEKGVTDVEVVDRVTAYESLPGYSAQQSTLNTQRFFTLFIGLLVIGGFFQIQTLQKVAQIGMLKAIGASNFTVATAAVTQIIIVNVIGITLGALGALGLSLSFPPDVPIIFTGQSVITAIATLMLIGPISGLLSVWSLLKIEPLTALGLAQ